MTSSREPCTDWHTLLVTRTGANEQAIIPTLWMRGFTPTDSAITLYTHKLWHRRYFLNQEVSYRLQSSITGSAFRGLLLILQKNSMLPDTKIFRRRMGAFRCIDTRYPSRVHKRIRWRSFYSLLRSDWVLAQLVRQNRPEHRTSCNSFSPDIHVSGTLKRHATRCDWPMNRAIGSLRAG